MTDHLRVYEPDELYVAGQHVGYPIAWTRPKGAAIKELIRELAGHRCVRCGHPYKKGCAVGQFPESKREYSPCDNLCTHETTDCLVRPTPVGWGSVFELLERGHTVLARARVLTTHHLNGNKADCRWWNLAALCQRCHLTIQGRVKMEQVYPHEHSPWFRPYAAGYYAWAYNGEELTREETEARLDELLALERQAVAL